MRNINHVQVSSNISPFLFGRLGKSFCEADADDENISVSELDALRLGARLQLGDTESTVRPRVIRERHRAVFAEEAHHVE